MIGSLLRRVTPRSAVRPLRRLAAVVPRPWRMGRAYWYWRHFLHDARQWPPEAVRAWQWERLRSIVRHAYEKIEGYRELYRQAGLHPDDLRSPEDLKYLPFSTKRTFQDNLEAFSDQRFGREYVTTGGSTGIPLGFYRRAETSAMELAFVHADWSMLGWRLEGVDAVLRGAFVGSADRPCQYDPYSRTLQLSSYYLTEKTLPAYIDAIRRYRPRLLQAYPSSLHTLCRLLSASRSAEPVVFDLFLLGSENIYPWQLEEVGKVFPTATVFGWYGHAENAIYAPWCALRRSYHPQPFYGWTELLRDDGQEAQAGEEGEIVGTGFHNFATPFIRYRTMDRAIRGHSPCEACGHAGLVLDRITGRSHELLVTGSGRLISMTAINMHDDIFDDLRQFQFFQAERGKVVFRYVPKRPLTDPERQRIHERLMVKLGGDVELSLAAVEAIPRTRSGKLSFLDQRLPVRAASGKPVSLASQEIHA